MLKEESQLELQVNGTSVASNKPFIDADFENLRLMRVEYVPITAAAVEALPGTYVIDDAVMERT